MIDLFLDHLECGRCKQRVDAGRLSNLCGECGGPLLARYDLDAVRGAVSLDEISSRLPGIWRYSELLPVSPRFQMTLGEGSTPVLPLSRVGEAWGLNCLLVKDEGLNPTGSFKARGAAVGIARARELGATAVTLPTAGNAGGAWAAYSARAGLDCHVFMPSDAPAVFGIECDLYGASTWMVDGLISDAGRIAEAQAKEHGWFVASTLKEPYRIEGKKTMGLEIAEGMGWRWPSAIVYPTGGGVGLIAIWKAVRELAELGWVEGPPPRMIAVQASGCRPVVDAFNCGASDTEFCAGASTIAAGIRVPGGVGHFLVLDAIYESGGTALDVSDDQLMATLRWVAALEGVWLCPEGAAGVAAVEKLACSGYLQPDDSILVLNTGSGLKYTDLLEGGGVPWPPQD